MIRRFTLLSFTDRGDALVRELAEELGRLEPGCGVTVSGRGSSRESRAEAVRRAFEGGNGEALIAIAALGITLRLIAPHIRDKFSDPAVIGMDDHANHVISLLSGHGGGANELTVRLAAMLRERGYRADPVVTTATDVRGARSAESVLEHYGIALEPNRAFIKQVNSRIANRPQDDRSEGEPAGDGHGMPDTRIDPELRIVWIGTGCRRDMPPDRYREEFEQFLAENRILPGTIAGFASIDLKADEAAIREAARSAGVPVTFYSADELRRYEDAAQGSEFVRSVTGVASVAAASAAAASGGGGLLTAVRRQNGCTFCAAIDSKVRLS